VVPTPLAPDVARPSPRRPTSQILPGTLIAARYRVVALLGRGGMGEVYRADDLKLGQPVALKFVPASVDNEAARLNRLLDEVRIARQISHPNVCRVYDVGEEAGRHFLSMEYIDGEDLASLLRRIGRLPAEKAVQIARQLCVGLAVAHDQGVLHRDLKPANVMIDGRGRARITDFGLAVLQENVAPEDVRSGTPAYMAPEQLEGRGVTARSDVYALGLVLYEIFAGRPAFEPGRSAEEIRARRSATPTAPSSRVESMEPAVERAILRCLELDPSLRPASPLAVAAALPGGDPLAAALAVGETPSPDLVAAAPDEGTLSLGRAAAALAAFLMLWAASIVLGDRPLEHLSFERSPGGLADGARDLLAKLGYDERPVDRGWGYVADMDLLLRLDDEPPQGLVEAALTGRVPVVRFWYRESQDYLVPGIDERVGPRDPPLEEPGAKAVELGPDGRLVRMRVVPSPRVGEADPARPPDWTPLFDAARLDRAELEPVAPAVTPPDYATVRSAWRSRNPGPAGGRLRVEAAALDGKPVYFEVVPEARTRSPEPPAAATLRVRVFYLLLGILFCSVLAAALLVARRNLTSGRGDRRSANRVAAVVMGGSLLRWIVSASHAPALQEFLAFFLSVAWALLAAGVVWVLYVALEPLLRRNAPSSLVSWTRLVSGRMQDPLVGRDLLLGSLVGGVFLCVALGEELLAWVIGRNPVPAPSGLHNLIGAAGVVRAATAALDVAFLQAMGFLVLWQVLSLALRSSLRGLVAVGLVLGFGLVVANGMAAAPFVVADVVVILFSLARLGLLATVTALWLFHLSLFFPISSDLSVWYAAESAAAFVVGALPAAIGAWFSTQPFRSSALPSP
jgi:serine/threonine-protein kinase